MGMRPPRGTTPGSGVGASPGRKVSGMPRRTGSFTMPMTSVTVYSTTWCPWCDRAKALLNARGIEFDGDQHRRSAGLPAEARGSHRRLDGPADRDRRAADRRLPAVARARRERRAREARRRLGVVPLDVRYAAGGWPGSMAPWGRCLLSVVEPERARLGGCLSGRRGRSPIRGPSF